ncbi:MAG: response regulator [Kiritimatiellae bacterium]|nr:response regulator [Kiritimatiellia bacterium]
MARILIADREPTLLDTVGLLLQTEGHRVVRVANAGEALEQVQARSAFDLLVTDLSIAPVDGETGISWMQRRQPTMDVIVVSDHLDDETVGKVFGLGAAGYVDKPYSLREIMDPIREVLLRRTRRGLDTEPAPALDPPPVRQEPPKFKLSVG